MNLDFCCDIQMVGSEFGVKNMKAWIHPALSQMALFHCMVRHGTVQYGSLLGGFPLGTVPGTWYFFSTTPAEVPSDPYRYQNITCKLYWSLIGRKKKRLYCVTEHATRDPPLQPYPLSDATFVWTNARFCINQKMSVSLYVEEYVCWGVCFLVSVYIFTSVSVFFFN